MAIVGLKWQTGIPDGLTSSDAESRASSIAFFGSNASPSFSLMLNKSSAQKTPVVSSSAGSSLDTSMVKLTIFSSVYVSPVPAMQIEPLSSTAIARALGKEDWAPL
ncbi:hypothetical protein D3C84_1064560 [compost metagenome]